MEYINLVLGLMSFFFIGYAPVYFLLTGKGGFKVGSRSVSGGFFIFFLSFFIGGLMTAWLLTMLSIFDIQFSTEIIYGTSAVFFVFYIYNFLSVRFRSSERKSMGRLDRDITAARERSRQKKKEEPAVKKETGPGADLSQGRPGESRSSRIIFIVLTALIILNFASIVFLTIIFPIRFWDAISCWSLKGKAFFIDGIINNFYTAHDYGFSHPSYPLYLPLMQTWLMSWMGKINENFLKIIFPIFYSSLLVCLYYLFRQRLRKLYSIIFVFIVSVLPIIVDHGYIEYANLIFSVVLLLAVYFFYLAAELGGKTTYLILSAMFFSITALTRSEGIIYLAVFMIMVLAFFFYRLAVKSPLKRNLLNLLMPAAVIIIFLVPWYALKLKLGLPAISLEWQLFMGGGAAGGLDPDFGRAAAVMGLQFLASAYDSTRAVLGSFYGPVWILLLLAMLFSLKRHFVRYNWIFFVFIFTGMVSIFISLASIPEFANSTERYILHLFPLAYYWIMTNSIGRSLRERNGRAR